MYVIQNGKIEFLAFFANSKLFLTFSTTTIFVITYPTLYTTYTYHHNQTLIFDLPPKLYKIQTIQHKKSLQNSNVTIV